MIGFEKERERKEKKRIAPDPSLLSNCSQSGEVVF
jgi:hypothetical protein